MKHRLSLYALTALLGIAVWWAWATRIDVAVGARGIVRPHGGVVQVVSEIGGRIVRVGAGEGEDVHSGDLLMQLDDSDLRLKERALLDRIHRTGEPSLYYDLEQCRLELNRRTITSPVDGRVVALTPLRSSEFVNSGTPIAGIVPTSEPLVVESWLRSTDRPLVKSGQAVRLQVEFRSYDGVVDSISPDAVFNKDSGSSAYRVVVKPAAFEGDLALGMTLQVHFITRQERLLLLLFQKIRRAFEENDE